MNAARPVLMSHFGHNRTFAHQNLENSLNIPPIGEVSCHPDIDEWLMSEPHALRCLNGHSVRFVFDGYTDEYQRDYQAALQNLINLDASALAAVAPHVAQYCREMISIYDPADRPDIRIVHASEIWKYVRFGDEMHIVRRAAGDDEDGIYFSLGSGCDWEQEHGLDLVLQDGLAFTKVGPIDGHITNSDAYGDRTLKGVIFASFR